MDKSLSNGPSPDLETPEFSAGLQPSDLLALPEPQSRVLTWMIRRDAVTFAEVMAFLGWEKVETHALLADLYDRGFVRGVEIGGILYYQVRLARRRGRTLPPSLWQALDGKTEQGREGRPRDGVIGDG